MTKEEFKFEILKANPSAVFIERRNGDLECTETEMLVRNRGSWRTPKEENVVADFEIVWVDLVVYGWSSQGFAKTEKRDFEFIAIPQTKKKRLMTPAECAGKWLFNPDNGGRALIIGFSTKETVHLRAECVTVGRLHSEGVLIADTPTSEPYSLEVTE